MVFHCALGQRVDQYVEPGAVQHQIRQDTFELVGLEDDFHVCFGDHGEFINCEELVNLFKGRPRFSTIRHELDFRAAYYHKYGHALPDATSGSINAWKIMVLYHYHFNSHLTLGGGSGAMPFYGSNFKTFTRGVLTPFSLVYSPPWAKLLTLRIEESYLTQEFSSARLGGPPAGFHNSGEWNFSSGIGFDFRRRVP